VSRKRDVYSWWDLQSELHRLVNGRTVPQCLPLLFSCLDNVRVEIVHSSTICKIHGIPDGLAYQLACELELGKDDVSSLIPLLNPKAGPDCQFWAASPASTDSLTALQRLEKPAFESPIQLRLFESRVQRNRQARNRLAELHAKWLKVARQEVWGSKSSFIFVYVQHDQPLDLARLFERKNHPRAETRDWVACVAERLARALPSGYQVVRGQVVPPPNRWCWFLATWCPKFMKQASEQTRRFLSQVDERVFLYSVSIPAPHV